MKHLSADFSTTLHLVNRYHGLVMSKRDYCVATVL